jgi:hypothetical protein
MVIQYYGDFCFKITTKPEGRATEDVVIWTDPLPKGAGLRSPIGEPDILIVSHSTEDVRVEKSSKKTILDMPGEFAARGVTVSGYGTFTNEKSPDFNTAFIIDTEGMQIGYLGNLGVIPDPDVLDRFSGIDILFMPVSSKNGLNKEEASSLVKKIEPKVIIPMHFSQKGLTIKDLSPVTDLTESLAGKAESLAKLNVKKKDIEADFMKVIILEKGS